MSWRDVPRLPLCHLWDEAKLILALLYELLELHGELLFHLLIAGPGVHRLQPTCPTKILWHQHASARVIKHLLIPFVWRLPGRHMMP